CRFPRFQKSNGVTVTRASPRFPCEEEFFGPRSNCGKSPARRKTHRPPRARLRKSCRALCAKADDEPVERNGAAKMRVSFKMTVAQLDVALDRPMPQSPDAERAVLGSILTNANAFYRVIGSIGTEDFFKDAHRTIFTAMRRLAEESREIDLLTVKEELIKRGVMEQAGGSTYVASLTD